MRIVLRLMLFCCIVLLTSCGVQPAVKVGPVTLNLVYSGNLDGELEPCGCSEGGNKGGIKRRVQKVDELRAQYPDLMLVSSGGLLVSDMPQDRNKSDFILQGLAQLDYDAVGLQWQDFAYGDAFLKQHNINWVVSNWSDKPFAAEKIIHRQGVSLHYFQWLDPEKNPAGKMTAVNGPASVADSFNAQLARVKKAGGLTMVATTLTPRQAQSSFDMQNIDVLLIKAKYELYGEPQTIGSTVVLQPGSRGMRLGRAALRVENGTVTLAQHEVIPLPPEVGDAPRMQAWYDRYNAAVKQAYQQRVELRKKMMSGESPYAGEKACKQCHQKQYDIWFDTRHAEAFYALQDAGKSFDPDCIGCHTVGFDKPGGFVDAQMTSRLQHVQCENCHGAAKKHVDSAGQARTTNHTWKPQQMCQQCHVQKHSPDFSFETYWPKIQHQGG